MPIVTITIPELDSLAVGEATPGTFIEVHDTGLPVGQQSRKMDLVTVIFAAMGLMDTTTRQDFVQTIIGALPVQSVANRTALRALPDNSARKIVFIETPEADESRAYRAVYGTPTDTDDGVSVIISNDGLTTYYEFPLN